MKLQEAGLCLVGFFMGLFLLNGSIGYAQYTVTGRILDVDEQYHDVYIGLYHNDDERKISLSNQGRFFTTLKWDQVYRFEFKKPGYVSKVIEFSTKVPVGLSKNRIDPYDMEIHLFEVFDGVDTVFFKNPVAKIRFDSRINDFADDRDYLLKVKYRIDQMRKQTVEAETEKRKKESIKKKNDKSISIKQIKKKSSDPLVDKKKEDELVVPPLKAHYKNGLTEEVFELHGRTIIRTVYCNNPLRKVFLCVKHHWGAEFYFLYQERLGYRCISGEVYHQMLKQLK